MAGKIPESEKNGRRSRRHPDASEAKTDTQVGFGSDDEVSGCQITVHGLQMPLSALENHLVVLKPQQH